MLGTKGSDFGMFSKVISKLHFFISYLWCVIDNIYTNIATRKSFAVWKLDPHFHYLDEFCHHEEQAISRYQCLSTRQPPQSLLIHTYLYYILLPEMAPPSQSEVPRSPVSELRHRQLCCVFPNQSGYCTMSKMWEICNSTFFFFF